MKKRNLIIACSALFTNTVFSSTELVFSGVSIHFTNLTHQANDMISNIITYGAFNVGEQFIFHGKPYAISNISNNIYNYKEKAVVTNLRAILESNCHQSLILSENGRLYLSLNSSAREMNGFLQITAILLANNEIPEGSILTAVERKNGEQKQEK